MAVLGYRPPRPAWYPSASHFAVSDADPRRSRPNRSAAVTGPGERSAAERGAHRAPMLGMWPGRHQRSPDVAFRTPVSDVLMPPRPPLVEFVRVLSRKHGQLRVARLDDIKQAPVDRPQDRVTAQSGDLGVELQVAAIE